MAVKVEIRRHMLRFILGCVPFSTIGVIMTAPRLFREREKMNGR